MAPKAADTVVSPSTSKDSEPTKKKKLTKEELEKKKEEDDISEEDKQLKEELGLCVTRLGKIFFSHKALIICNINIGEAQADLWGNALTSMATLIWASTTSMTLVPKPLKFMIPHLDDMKAVSLIDDLVFINHYIFHIIRRLRRWVPEPLRLSALTWCLCLL